jgi:predicted esterase
MAAVSYRLGTRFDSLEPATRKTVKTNRRRARTEGITIANRLLGSAFEAARQDIGTAMAFLSDHRGDFDIQTQKQAIIGLSAGGIAGLALAFPDETLPSCPRPDAVVALGAALVMPWALSTTGTRGLMIHSHYDRVISPDNTDVARNAVAQTDAPLNIMTCARKGHNAPAQALLDDDAPDGTPYWFLMRDLFRDAGLFGPA